MERNMQNLNKEAMFKEYILDNYNYNPQSGEVSRKVDGSKVGHVNNTNGYGMLTINQKALFGKEYKFGLHRVAWLLHTGDWPKQVIDHLNCDKLDNRIANLEDVSQGENTRRGYEARAILRDAGITSKHA